MIKKLKTYKTFENFKGENSNYEKEIDKILESLVQQKVLISMLGDTINHVSSTIENMLPDDLDNFLDSLEQYEESVHDQVVEIINNLIEGRPNLKDMIEEVEININEIEKYLKEKS